MAAKSKRTSALKVGALVVLASCFLLSALFRAGEVIAALPATDDGFGNPIAQAPADGTISAGDGAPETGIPAEGPEVLIAELKRQRAEIRAREAAIAEREQRLDLLERRLKERLEQIRSAREQLARTAALVDDAAGKDVARLAQMYQQMKPKQAGQIFNEMAPSFAAGFMAEMRPDAAALIMANMEAEKAYAVSLLLAGRNMNSQGQAVPQPQPSAPAPTQ